MPNISALTSSAAVALAIGPNGATNPVLTAKCDVSSAATGLRVTGRAAAAGADLEVISSGSNENLRLTPKGTGAVVTASPVNITSAGANALAVGRQGTTDPSLKVDASAGTAATGIEIVSAAAASGVNVRVISSGTNEMMAINAKGTGSIDLNPTGTGNVTTPRGILSRGTLGIGYATGAGAAVTQGTSRTTAVTCNGASGAVTLVSAAGSTTPFSFTVNNSAVAATDVVIVNQKSGTDKYDIDVTAVGAGSFQLTLNTKSGTTTEQPVFNFAVIKAVAA